MKYDEEIIDSYVITITSGKGGVGKSIIASNLANVLSNDYRVLIWDANMDFPNQHIMFGVEPPVRVNDVYESNVHVSRAVFNIKKNLDLLADTPARGDMQEFDSSVILDVYRQLLIESKYDFIIIDTPAIISETLLQCCNISDLIAVVVNDEPTSLLDAYGLLKILLPYISEEYINMIVNNVIDIEDSDEISDKLNMATEKFLDIKLNNLGFIPYNRNVRQSIVQQTLLTNSKPESEVSEAIKNISKKILNKLELEEKINNI